MTRIALLSALLVWTTVYGGSADSAKSALSEYFRLDQQGPRLEKDSKTTSLEVCFDTCDYYRASGGTPELTLWDLAFLHQYYFNDPYHLEKFRARYVSVAKDTLKRHAGGCRAADEKTLARCVMLRLADGMKAEYAFVRYDEGGRCEVAGRLTDPTYQGKSVCKRLKVSSLHPNSALVTDACAAALRTAYSAAQRGR
jgi:hypothetical protein